MPYLLILIIDPTERLKIQEYIDNFAKENKPISKIYNLVKSNKDDQITINEIRGIKKFIALRYATDY